VIVLRAFATAWLVAAGALRLAVRREPPARVLARTLERLGPTYVKLGQLLATRRDLLPAEAVTHLERLQDRLEPAPFATLPWLFREELGVELDDVFAALDPDPIASASIACVYRGVLRDGTEVAVKARRPDVARRIELDLRLIRGGARIAARLPGLPGLRGLPVLAALDEFGACLRRQVDLGLEADANRRIRAALVDEPDVLVPALVERYCSESLLTMELLPVERGRRDPSRRPALLAALRALYRMIFVEGFVHCDLHGANLFLLPDGRAAMVDFGFTAELPTEARLQFAEFFLAMAMNDGARCTRITLDTAAYVPPQLDYRVLEAEVSALVARAAGAAVDDFRVADFVLGLFEIQRRHRIVGTTAFTMAIVSLLVFEGMAKEVAGDLDFGREAVPFVLRALASGPASADAAA
jgi:ubiquinone biosynthesis protein